MCAGVDLSDPLAGHVGVELGRTDTRMSEQFLNDPQVGAALEEMRRERVAERVGADPSVQSRTARRGPDDGERLLPGQPAAPVAEEQRSAPFDRRMAQLEEERPAVVEPLTEPVDRDVADRHEPLAVALADDPDEAAVEREVLEVQARRLADAEARGVEQLEQGP